MSDGNYIEGSWFFYAPNKGAAVFFTVAFASSALVHCWQCYRYRSYMLMILILACSIVLTAGFAVRIYCAIDYQNIRTFIATTFLVYSAPPVLELANYHILGRILSFVPYCSPLHPGRVFTTFAILSCIVEVLNALGVTYSSISALPPTTIRTGQALLKASLVLQLVVALLFAVLAVSFHRRCLSRGVRDRRVVGPLVTLYVSTALITVRTVYRVVEYWAAATVSGSPSPVVRHEWFFLVFEASVVLLDCVLFNVFHPRRFLPRNSKTFLALDGVSEVEGPGWSDSRPWMVTLCDPFDVMGAIRPAGKSGERFWETDGVESVLSGSKQVVERES